MIAGLIAGFCAGGAAERLSDDDVGFVVGLPVLIVVVTLREILNALRDLAKVRTPQEVA